MVSVNKSRQVPVLVEQRYEEEMGRAYQAVGRAKSAIARARKALNKSHAVCDQAQRLATAAARRERRLLQSAKNKKAFPVPRA